MLRISCRISSMLDRRKKCLRPPCHRSLSNPNSTFTRSSSTIREHLMLSLALPNNSSKVPIPSLQTQIPEESYFYRSKISNSSSSKQSNQIYNYPQLFQGAHTKGPWQYLSQIPVGIFHRWSTLRTHRHHCLTNTPHSNSSSRSLKWGIARCVRKLILMGSPH